MVMSTASLPSSKMPSNSPIQTRSSSPRYFASTTLLWYSLGSQYHYNHTWGYHHGSIEGWQAPVLVCLSAQVLPPQDFLSSRWFKDPCLAVMISFGYKTYQQTVASVEIVSGYNWFIPKETRKEREKSGRSLIDGTQRLRTSPSRMWVLVWALVR